MSPAVHVLRLLFALVVLGVLAAGAGVALRAVFPSAWKRFLRKAWIAGFGLCFAALCAWNFGRATHDTALVRASAPVAAVLAMTALALFVTSPVWGALGAGVRLAPDPRRRAFLGRALGVVPVTAALTGPAGAVGSSGKPVLRRLELASALVPPALDGFTILQISDVHLGPFVDVSQVRSVVDAARPHAPDLVALTGDIADDYAMLPPALDLVRSLAPRCGTFAIVGNHEIYRGREEARAICEAHGARWLCDDGVVVDKDGARFWLGGTDDPARSFESMDAFYARSVSRCLARCPPGVGCRVVLAHRPTAFDATAAQGVAVTLSGHTHGAQMALFGRSLLEGLIPMKYLLGRYRKSDSVLYTTAGLGHWLPFRLNCPTEAALVTLRAA